MARPETISDLPEDTKYISVGDFNISRFVADPNVLKAYASLVEAIGRRKGRVTNKYSGGSGYIEDLATKAELEDSLGYAQRRWDSQHERYQEALAGTVTIDSYGQNLLIEWIQEEGLEIPPVLADRVA